MPEAATRWQPSLGVWPDEGAGRVRVWAPEARTVAVRPAADGPATALEPDGRGYFGGRVPWLQAGTRYWLVMDGERVMPDPASRSQPDGVHGASEVIDPSAFAWHDAAWRGRAMAALVIYELHVGTFTAAGTFAAAAERLDDLAALGVTAVELMPVAAFPGRWNWGYDPAAQFAPASVYGSPDDLRRFVDRAHAVNLCVILDVVYNHFGPDGAYAAAWSPRFFSARHASPWGAGINLDGPDAAAVRHFFIENALHWLVEYHIDGLRVDATHALIDDSPAHLLADLSTTARAALPERQIVLIAEDNRNLRQVLEPAAAGGWGFDGLWSDDFHHVARRLVAGDAEGYFRDYRGTTGELARTLRGGWLFRGEHSPHAGGPRGSDPDGLPLAACVICLQNHDQIGNRAFGDRLDRSVDLATYRALTVLLLLAPETPLLFMGQEWAASSPFLYFTDHAGDLGRQVREGRREEFRHFQAFADAAIRDRIPDPQAASSFDASRLAWDERTRAPHAGVLALHRALLQLRASLAPAGPSGTVGADAIAALDAATMMLRRTTHDDGELLVLVRLTGEGTVVVPVAVAGGGSDAEFHGEPSAPPAPADWQRVLDSEFPEFTGDARPIAVETRGDLRVRFARPGALVLRLAPRRVAE